MTIIKLKNDIHIQQQMAELKLDFFTDISHEIRTPLTMITAPVEKMLADKGISETIKSQLQGIEKNSNRLLDLVNQILDLRKIQNKKLEIKEVILGDYVSTICENFKEISLYKKIRLEQCINQNNSIVWADLDSLDKIMGNLLSNAFKFCNEGDIVRVSVDETERNVILRISDNGPGISQKIQKRLFLRFSNYNNDSSKPSTGIGLSIVKDLVDKHGASISVKSENGKGSCFKVSFLKGYKHFNEDVEILFRDRTESNDNECFEEQVINISDDIHRSMAMGLIVEDDFELRDFIVSVLEDTYLIKVADNGIEGHLKAAKYSPDFIISDIMMPKMDGIDMLKLIRNDITTSHIPVILLTAKTSIENRLEGMEYGADDYLTKPFNIAYLKARIDNILKLRKHLQLLYSSGNIANIATKENIQISSQDHKFMLDVINLVKQNMAKSDFTVIELGKLMGMSRASFYNKLKGVSGTSPVEFIRDMRLDKAAELLKNNDLMIKEICFEVGFSDLKYFGKCFKSKFNYSPNEYRHHYR